MKLILSSICLAIIFTSCTSTGISHRSWVETVDAADKSSYNRFMEINQADPTVLMKYKIRF